MNFLVKNWRGYYVRQLMSLDEKARKIIQENSECIVSDDSREEVRKFVEKIAEHNYNTEHWRTGKISEKIELSYIEFFVEALFLTKNNF